MKSVTKNFFFENKRKAFFKTRTKSCTRVRVKLFHRNFHKTVKRVAFFYEFKSNEKIFCEFTFRIVHKVLVLNNGLNFVSFFTIGTVVKIHRFFLSVRIHFS